MRERGREKKVQKKKTTKSTSITPNEQQQHVPDPPHQLLSFTIISTSFFSPLSFYKVERISILLNIITAKLPPLPFCLPRF